tara:strand:- start:520 stop:720 length:201 start_codon:yes stop_codon:yes gene_type:complete
MNKIVQVFRFQGVTYSLAGEVDGVRCFESDSGSHTLIVNKDNEVLFKTKVNDSVSGVCFLTTEQKP